MTRLNLLLAASLAATVAAAATQLPAARAPSDRTALVLRDRAEFAPHPASDPARQLRDRRALSPADASGPAAVLRGGPRAARA